MILMTGLKMDGEIHRGKRLGQLKEDFLKIEKLFSQPNPEDEGSRIVGGTVSILSDRRLKNSFHASGISRHFDVPFAGNALTLRDSLAAYGPFPVNHTR
jgi:hypothetical protein